MALSGRPALELSHADRHDERRTGYPHQVEEAFGHLQAYENEGGAILYKTLRKRQPELPQQLPQHAALFNSSQNFILIHSSR